MINRLEPCLPPRRGLCKWISIFRLYNRCRVLGQTSISGADDDTSFAFPLRRIFVLDGVHNCPFEFVLP